MKIVRFVALLPRNVCVALLRAYRAVISPLYGDVCRYYPSCSTYTLQAIQSHGALKGIALGSWRIARCNPWAAGGIDDVPERHTAHGHEIRVLTSGFVVAADKESSSGATSPLPLSPRLRFGSERLHFSSDRLHLRSERKA